VDAVILTMLDRPDEALGLLRPREQATPPNWPVLIYLTSLRAQLEGKTDECVSAIRRWAPLQRDAEGAFYTSRQLAHLGAIDDALTGLERSLAGGYFCLPAALDDPWRTKPSRPANRTGGLGRSRPLLSEERAAEILACQFLTYRWRRPGAGPTSAP
jgi:hypothetical protein